MTIGVLQAGCAALTVASLLALGQPPVAVAAHDGMAVLPRTYAAIPTEWHGSGPLVIPTIGVVPPGLEDWYDPDGPRPAAPTARTTPTVRIPAGSWPARTPVEPAPAALPATNDGPTGPTPTVPSQDTTPPQGTQAQGTTAQGTTAEGTTAEQATTAEGTTAEQATTAEGTTAEGTTAEQATTAARTTSDATASDAIPATQAHSGRHPTTTTALGTTPSASALPTTTEPPPPTEEPPAQQAPAEEPAPPAAGTSARGHTVHRLGEELTVLDAGTGALVLSIGVDAVSADLTCTGPDAAPAVHGQLIAVHLRAVTGADLSVLGGAPAVRAADFAFLDAAEGAALYAADSASAQSCLPGLDAFPEGPLDSDRGIAGVVVLDVPAITGTLVFAPRWLPVGGEWSF